MRKKNNNELTTEKQSSDQTENHQSFSKRRKVNLNPIELESLNEQVHCDNTDKRKKQEKNIIPEDEYKRWYTTDDISFHLENLLKLNRENPDPFKDKLIISVQSISNRTLNNIEPNSKLNIIFHQGILGNDDNTNYIFNILNNVYINIYREKNVFVKLSMILNYMNHYFLLVGQFSTQESVPSFLSVINHYQSNAYHEKIRFLINQLNHSAKSVSGFPVTTNQSGEGQSDHYNCGPIALIISQKYLVEGHDLNLMLDWITQNNLKQFRELHYTALHVDRENNMSNTDELDTKNQKPSEKCYESNFDNKLARHVSILEKITLNEFHATIYRIKTCGRVNFLRVTDKQMEVAENGNHKIFNRLSYFYLYYKDTPEMKYQNLKDRGINPGIETNKLIELYSQSLIVTYNRILEFNWQKKQPSITKPDLIKSKSIYDKQRYKKLKDKSKPKYFLLTNELRDKIIWGDTITKNLLHDHCLYSTKNISGQTYLENEQKVLDENEQVLNGYGNTLLPISKVNLSQFKQTNNSKEGSRHSKQNITSTDNSSEQALNISIQHQENEDISNNDNSSLQPISAEDQIGNPVNQSSAVICENTIDNETKEMNELPVETINDFTPINMENNLDDKTDIDKLNQALDGIIHFKKVVGEANKEGLMKGTIYLIDPPHLKKRLKSRSFAKKTSNAESYQVVTPSINFSTPSFIPPTPPVIQPVTPVPTNENIDRSSDEETADSNDFSPLSSYYPSNSTTPVQNEYLEDISFEIQHEDLVDNSPTSEDESGFVGYEENSDDKIQFFKALECEAAESDDFLKPFSLKNEDSIFPEPLNPSKMEIPSPEQGEFTLTEGDALLALQLQQEEIEMADTTWKALPESSNNNVANDAQSQLPDEIKTSKLEMDEDEELQAEIEKRERDKKEREIAFQPIIRIAKTREEREKEEYYHFISSQAQNPDLSGTRASESMEEIDHEEHQAFYQPKKSINQVQIAEPVLKQATDEKSLIEGVNKIADAEEDTNMVIEIDGSSVEANNAITTQTCQLNTSSIAEMIVYSSHPKINYTLEIAPLNEGGFELLKDPNFITEDKYEEIFKPLFKTNIVLTSKDKNMIFEYFKNNFKSNGISGYLNDPRFLYLFIKLLSDQNPLKVDRKEFIPYTKFFSTELLDKLQKKPLTLKGRNMTWINFWISTSILEMNKPLSIQTQPSKTEKESVDLIDTQKNESIKAHIEVEKNNLSFLNENKKEKKTKKEKLRVEMNVEKISPPPQLSNNTHSLFSSTQIAQSTAPQIVSPSSNKTGNYTLALKPLKKGGFKLCKDSNLITSAQYEEAFKPFFKTTAILTSNDKNKVIKYFEQHFKMNSISGHLDDPRFLYLFLKILGDQKPLSIQKDVIIAYLSKFNAEMLRKFSDDTTLAPRGRSASNIKQWILNAILLLDKLSKEEKSRTNNEFSSSK